MKMYFSLRYPPEDYSFRGVGDERKRSKDTGLQGKREKELSDPNNP
jgi:hypothetical protein